jgi:hypothetical protein
MHGGKAPGAPKGNSHAFKHGRYTAGHIAERRHFADLLCEMKGLVVQVDGEEQAIGHCFPIDAASGKQANPVRTWVRRFASGAIGSHSCQNGFV